MMAHDTLLRLAVGRGGVCDWFCVIERCRNHPFVDQTHLFLEPGRWSASSQTSHLPGCTMCLSSGTEDDWPVPCNTWVKDRKLVG